MFKIFGRSVPLRSYQYLILECLSNSLNPSPVFTLSVQRQNSAGQNEISSKRLFSNVHTGENETTSCSKSQTECTGESKKWPSKSKLQYRLHPETEAALNLQINAEFKAFYYYLSMAAYFGRIDVALPGCESYFMQMHKEEYGHALQLINYLKNRGGTVQLCEINSSDEAGWLSPLHAFQAALDLEIAVTDDLIAVSTIAEKHNDLSAIDFIVTNFIDDQMRSISEIARFVTVLSNLGDQGLARFIFDRDLLENYVSRKFNVLRNSDHSSSNHK